MKGATDGKAGEAFVPEDPQQHDRRMRRIAHRGGHDKALLASALHHGVLIAGLEDRQLFAVGLHGFAQLLFVRIVHGIELLARAADVHALDVGPAHLDHELDDFRVVGRELVRDCSGRNVLHALAQVPLPGE
jgi:hypothetical protein